MAKVHIQLAKDEHGQFLASYPTPGSGVQKADRIWELHTAPGLPERWCAAVSSGTAVSYFATADAANPKEALLSAVQNGKSQVDKELMRLVALERLLLNPETTVSDS